MTPIEERGGNSGRAERFVRGALPVVVVCLLLWGLSKDSSPQPITVAAVFAACGLVLWFAWSAIRGNLATKWLGAFLAFWVGLVLVLFSFWTAIGLSIFLFVFFLVALPFLLFDLLFRAPFEGRFARARAGRRHLRS